MGRRSIFLLIATLAWAVPQGAGAAHPLITDDAGTEGRNGLQWEMTSDFSRDGAQDGAQWASVFSYGVHETADLIVGVPYLVSRVRQPRPVQTDSGFGDLALELKWRFWEADGWSFALRPGASLMTGDETRGFGTGRAAYSLFAIGSREIGPAAFHANAGYIGNENKLDERVHLWHASLAAGYTLFGSLQVVSDFRAQGNASRSDRQVPVAWVGGLIYSVRENLDLDLGYRTGLTASEAGDSILFGLAWRR